MGVVALSDGDAAGAEALLNLGVGENEPRGRDSIQKAGGRNCGRGLPSKPESTRVPAARISRRGVVRA